MPYNKLTPEEAYVIEQKGTEPPFSGEYDDFYEDGMFVCRRCDAPLFSSQAKFDAGCNVPSFDDSLPNAVTRTLEANVASSPHRFSCYTPSSGFCHVSRCY